MEAEIRQNEPQIKINPSDVSSAFERFQTKAAEGFPTQEENLYAYGRLLATAASFFKRSDISHLPETRDLISNLFYHHSGYAEIPIEFFTKVSKQLTEDVQQNNKIKSSDKPLAELSIIRQEAQSEAGNVWQEYLKEKHLRLNLQELADQNCRAEEEINLSLDINSSEETTKYIQKTTIDLLSRDAELGAEIRNIHDYQKVLAKAREIDIDSEPNEVKEMLDPYSELMQQPGDLPTNEEINLRLELGQNNYVHTMLASLEHQANEPDFIWNHLLKKGYLPKELVESFEDLAVLSNLQRVATAISEAPKPVKAKFLLPFLEKGISAGVLTEIAEGESLPDNLIERQIDVLLHFWDTYKDQQKQPASFKQKLRVALFSVMTATIVASTPYSADASDQLVAVEEPASSDSGQQEPTSPELNLQPQEEDQMPSLSERDSAKPENSGNIIKQTIWNLSGKEEDFPGFYRDETASVFDPETKAWIINKTQEEPVSFSSLPQKSDITLTGEALRLQSSRTPILTRDGYVLSMSGFNIVGATGPISVSERTDGNHVLHFSEKDVGKTLSISYGLSEVSRSNLPLPDKEELEKMKQKIVSLVELPIKEKDIVARIIDSDISDSEKATQLEQYVKNALKYSLDREKSDLYHSSPTTREFIEDIFFYKEADCDVANTALVALLRSADFPSRMAYGFANSGGFLDNSKNNQKKLVTTESHGWVEAFVDGKWISLDGTPSSMTEDAANELDPKELPDFPKYVDWIIYALAANTGLFGTAELLRRNNSKKGKELRSEVETRTRRYFGSDFEKVKRVLEPEYLRIGPNYPQTRKFLGLVPPVGLLHIVAALKDTGNLQDTSDLLSRSKNNSMSPDLEPNLQEFLTNVLGYPEGNARKIVYDENYANSTQIIDHQLQIEKNSTADDLGLRDSQIDSWTKFIKRRLSDKTKPLAQKNFPQVRDEITDELYRRYERARKGQTSSVINPRQFYRHIDSLIRIELIAQQAALAYKEAIQDAKKYTNARLSGSRRKARL